MASKMSRVRYYKAAHPRPSSSSPQHPSMLLSTIFPAFLIIPLASAAILNFDDLQAPNNPNCGSVSLATTPYNGFTITNAAVVNTTQTQFCHESSGGSGPWNKAQSLPNLLAGYNTIAFSSATKFKITAFKLVTNIHWTVSCFPDIRQGRPRMLKTRFRSVRSCRIIPSFRWLSPRPARSIMGAL